MSSHIPILDKKPYSLSLKDFDQFSSLPHLEPMAKAQLQRAPLDSPPASMNDAAPRIDTHCPETLGATGQQIAKFNMTEPRALQVWCESRARIPTTTQAEVYLHLYKNNLDSKEHLAIVFGDHLHSRTLFASRENETEHERMTRGAYTEKLVPGRSHSGTFTQTPNIRDEGILCRIHSECFTGETAWSARCDCGEQLDEAARLMAADGTGVIVYLRQEGRGIGLSEKLKAYNLQDLGADTVQANLMLQHPADGRSYDIATAILLDLQVKRIRLLTNNPDKVVKIEGEQKLVQVTSRISMIPLFWQSRGGFDSEEVQRYLETKVKRMGHILEHHTL